MVSCAPLLALALAAATPEPIPIADAPRLASLQGGDTLGVGGSDLAFTAGYSTFSLSYAQGLSDGVDVGAQVEIDWLTGELFAGGLYRQLTLRHGDVAVSWRGRAGAYLDLGSTWAVSSNHDAAGVELAPGVALSSRTARGVVSVGLDLPVILVFSNTSGYAISARGAVAFETPLWSGLLVGARVGAAGTWSRSGAPFAGDSPRATVDLSALLTYRLL